MLFIIIKDFYIKNTLIIYFSGINVASLLGYKDASKAVVNNVDKADRKPFRELEQFIENKPKNAQPYAIYINESGLYSMVMNSRKPYAKNL